MGSKMRLLANIQSLYGWKSALILAALLDSSKRRPLNYLGKFWTTQNFSTVKVKTAGAGNKALVNLLRLGMALQLLAGLAVMFYAADSYRPGYFLFGLAIIVAYPLVWAHVLGLAGLLAVVLRAPGTMTKSFGKALLCRLLERQVVRLRAKYQFSLVAVAGSVGKTSTKLAIANTLERSRSVQFQDGNYNDRLTVPLVIFGQPMPGLFNVLAWIKILLKNSRIIAKGFNYDVVVVEIGTDGPGQMKKFAYLRPDLTVLTAIQPEHMEQFGTLRKVADEELAIFNYSQRVLVNIDDVAAKYLKGRQYVSYGSKSADYALKSQKHLARDFGAQRVNYNLSGHKTALKINYLGHQGAKVALAAAAAACELAVSLDDIKSALSHLYPPAGRMRILKGVKNSKIIDDTYNASPSATEAALEVLQSSSAPQRFAILGSMNELGKTSRKSHQKVGRVCDPSKLDLVVTIGQEANDYLAPAAKKVGCEVRKFTSPKEAGEFVANRLKNKALILAKGSQNGVFAEEAVKQLLADPADAAKLVRQSPAWLKTKSKNS